jgi:hypothetical protein
VSYIKAEVKNNTLFIEIPLQTPTASGSGKNLVIASTHGITVSGASFNGNPVKIGLNAFVKA